MSDIILGIDLGTTFSVISFLNPDGEAKVIPVSCGIPSSKKPDCRIVPSVIWVGDDKIFVGKDAEMRRSSARYGIIEFIKRQMGKYKLDEEKNILLDDDNNPIPVFTRNIWGETYDAEELSALILAKMVQDANLWLEEEGYAEGDVKDVIITVPAYFDDTARKATEKSGRLAGLNVLGIINEPTAAAIAYGVGKSKEEAVMVFDLGGGTFDVTLMNIRGDGSCEVIVSDGSIELGGKNWDGVLEKYFAKELIRTHNFHFPESYALTIRENALKAKLKLTDQEETIVLFKHNNAKYKISINRETFKRRSSTLLAACKARCRNVIERAAKIKKIDGWASLKKVILVGGSSRMPMIKEICHEVTGGYVEIVEGDHDLAISMGAAIYAKNTTKVIDVTPKTLGVRVHENGVEKISKMILKDTPLPCEKTEAFLAPKYSKVSVEQGDGDAPDGYRAIGTLFLRNEEPDHVSITYKYDKSGMIHVSVKGEVVGEHQLHLNDHSCDIMDAQFMERYKKVKKLINCIN